MTTLTIDFKRQKTGKKLLVFAWTIECIAAAAHNGQSNVLPPLLDCS